MAAKEKAVEDNKRSVPRRHLIYYLRVFDVETNSLLGNLVDISTKGIMVVSDRHVEPGKLYKLKMVLPDTVDGRKEVEFDAESRWCQHDANDLFYDTGFELMDPQPEFLDAVDRLVEDCLFKE
ncbi:MAG: pilus assembly protein PilZ [Pseudomonadales bacterium]|nr:pilus assembly protein PilZ [Pseudomonadales bacterium]RLU03013.1 MAG: PilZ domain-containing protein [Ketobacter sp.]